MLRPVGGPSTSAATRLFGRDVAIEDGLSEDPSPGHPRRYKPAETALLLQARAAGCGVAQGASMLVAQGVAQFQQWTGRVAPVPAMRAAVFEGVAELEGA